MTTSPFVPLRTYSDYSLGYSNIKVKALVEYCAKHGIPAVALTDTMNLFGAVEFTQKCLEYGVQPIVGTFITVYDGDHDKQNDPYQQYHNNDFILKSVTHITLLVKSQVGYQNLIKLVSYPHLYLENTTQNYVPREEILAHSDGMIALLGEDSKFGYLVKNGDYDDAEAELLDFFQHFGSDLFIELVRYSDHKERYFEKHAIRLAYKHNIPIVATNPAQYLTPHMRESHDVLLCIANTRYISESERPKSCSDGYLKIDDEMYKLFADIPEAIENTSLIAKKCSYIVEMREPMLPKFCDGEYEMLAREAKDGLNRYLQVNDIATSHPSADVYRDRLAYELEMINRMGFPGYFLIVSDFVKWSKKNNIPVGPGRGSGAGSLVAFALDITTIDPLKFGLLFERFLNPDRVSMPDLDIDFCQVRRDEVIKYVREKYGISRVSHIITFGKLQARAVLRDVGRVLQMPYNVVDRISKMVPHNPANPITLQQAIDLDKEMQYLRDSNPDIERLLRISLQLEGVFRHTSTHAAGILIAAQNTIEIAPLYRDRDAMLPAVQYSMKYAEAVGLIKFDFLGLKTLTVLHDACKLIHQQHQKDINLNQLPLDDKETYALLSTGRTIGVFQFEGYGMRESIKSLKPDKIEDLVALSSLYRPGPMENIPRYISRKHGVEKVDYIHPQLSTILKETYGIIVYQEQVMQIAQTLAGYSLAEADLLRKAMGKKNKAEMQKQRDIFIERAITRDVQIKNAEDIFDLLEKFASYGFNKSHAVAYSIISYYTAYLKTHYTVEYLIASINLEISDNNKIHIFCREANAFGIEVLRPSINMSDVIFSIEKDSDDSQKRSIRFGLLGIRSIGLKIIQSIVEERKKNGHYKSIFDFMKRTVPLGLNKKTLEGLVKSGALEEIHNNSAQIISDADILLRSARSHNASHQQQHTLKPQLTLFQQPLLDTGIRHYIDNLHEVKLSNTPYFSTQQKLQAEYEALGFHISTHPILEYKTRLHKKCIMPMASIEHLVTKKAKSVNIAGMIVNKKIRSGKGGKFAFLQLSDETGIIDASIFDEDLLCRAGSLLQDGSFVFCKISILKDQRGLRVIIESIQSVQSMCSNISSKYIIRIYNDDKEALSAVRALLASADDVKQNLAQRAPDIDDDNVPFSSIQIILISKRGDSVYCSIDHTENTTRIYRQSLLALNGISNNIKVTESFT